MQFFNNLFAIRKHLACIITYIKWRDIRIIRILLAEDDDALGTLVKVYLEASGYEVTFCHNGLEALTQLNASDYAMVITDIMMPVMDGFTLAKRIREQNKTLPHSFYDG